MNTIEAIGDYQLFASIVDRSISELVDDNIDKINRQSLFFKCSDLTHVDLPNVTRIGQEVFLECSGLTSINLPALIHLGQMAFKQCVSLKNIILPSATEFDPKPFEGCTSLESASLPVCTQLAGSVFTGCTALTNVDLPLIKQIEYAFWGCSSLVSVNMPTLTILGSNTFYGCKSIERLDLPLVETIKDNALNGASNLKTLILRTTAKVVTLYNATNSLPTSSFTTYVPDSLVDSYKEATNWSTYADRIKPLSELPAEEGA